MQTKSQIIDGLNRVRRPGWPQIPYSISDRFVVTLVRIRAGKVAAAAVREILSLAPKGPSTRCLQ